ncbi:MAG: Uma2 family endonuclease [Dehalococcoidia bacterium]
MTTAARSLVPLENGASFSSTQEFMEAYERTEASMKAELVEGIVYIRERPDAIHGEASAALAGWLGQHVVDRPHLRPSLNATVLLDERNVVQPDLHMRVLSSSRNRRAGPYLEGPPELVGEVAFSSASIDLHQKLETYRTHGVLEYIVWRVYDDAIDWFWLNEGAYERLQPDRRGVVESRVFPGLRLAIPAMLKGDLKAVLAELQRG